MEAREFKKPAIFIGGPGRSGTSFLARLFDSHSKIAMLGETKILSIFPLARNFPRMLHDSPKEKREGMTARMAEIFQKDYWVFPHRPTRGLHCHFVRDELVEVLPLLKELAWLDDLESIEKGYGFFLGSLFSQYSRRRGKPFWVEKTPQVEKYASTLRKFFPNFNLVCLYRDGRDAACSVVEQAWGPNEYKEALDWWAKNTMEGLTATKDLPAGTVLNVKYEDLAEQPGWVFEAVLEFLGFEPDPDAPPLVPRTEAVGRWKKDLPAEAVKYAETRYGHLLSGLGYV
ncbi:MAG: sulfotransferase [Pseudomonadota bacterium]